MEIKPAGAKRFIDKPPPEIRVFLLFGPDEGLIRERGDLLVGQIVPDSGDPFRLADLEGDAVNADAALLYDEATALAFGGGQRAVRVRRLTGRIADAVIDMVREPAGEARIVLEAPGANRKSAIVAAAIGAAAAAAVPCYRDESRTLHDLVREAMTGAGLRPGPGVVDFVADLAGGDRALTRREIEKLALFVGAAPEEGRDGKPDEKPDSGRGAGPKPVDLAQAQAVIGDTALLTLDSLVDATFEGRIADIERMLQRVRQEGVASGTILRAMAGQAARLMRMRGLMQTGLDPAEAALRLRPPVHFSRRKSLERQARMAPQVLAAAMDRLAEAERLTRRTGIPDEPVCDRALSGIAAAVRRR
ncbi:MAG: DNA polymerase III subunit delta [Rhodospirillaceae bacterium]|nr:DNA polymerase III subunit delta [Rhodospirillaceae bacterium]